MLNKYIISLKRETNEAPLTVIAYDKKKQTAVVVCSKCDGSGQEKDWSARDSLREAQGLYYYRPCQKCGGKGHFVLGDVGVDWAAEVEE